MVGLNDWLPASPVSRNKNLSFINQDLQKPRHHDAGVNSLNHRDVSVHAEASWETIDL